MPSVFKLFPQQCCPVISMKIIWRKTAPTHKMILFALLPSAPVVMSVIKLSCSSSTPRPRRPDPKPSAFCGAVLLLTYSAWAVGGQRCCCALQSPAAPTLPGSLPVGIQHSPPHTREGCSSPSGAAQEHCCVPAGSGALPTTPLLLHCSGYCTASTVK